MVHNRQSHEVISLLSLECWLEDNYRPLEFCSYSSLVVQRFFHPPASTFPAALDAWLTALGRKRGSRGATSSVECLFHVCFFFSIIASWSVGIEVNWCSADTIWGPSQWWGALCVGRVGLPIAGSCVSGARRYHEALVPMDEK